MPVMSLFHYLRTVTAKDALLLHVIQVYVKKDDTKDLIFNSSFFLP